MGGYNAGEVASGIAVNVVSSGMMPELRSGRELSKVDIASGLTHAALLLQQKIAVANKGIYEAAQARPECAGMGTTLVSLVFCGNRVSIGHIGDSRCYRLRGEKFEQLTRDHSLLQEQIDSGQLTPEQARFSLNKNLVTRALGIEAIVPADIVEYRVEANDIYLLNSDGLTDMVERRWCTRSSTKKRDNLSEAAKELVDLANQNGGRDNISVVLVRVPQGVPAECRVGAALAREEDARARQPEAASVGKLVHFHADGTTLDDPARPRAHHDRPPRRQRRLPAVSRGERRACGGRDDPRRLVPRGPRQHQRHARQRRGRRQAFPARSRPDRHRPADLSYLADDAATLEPPPRSVKSPDGAGQGESTNATLVAPAALRAKRRSDVVAPASATAVPKSSTALGPPTRMAAWTPIRSGHPLRLPLRRRRGPKMPAPPPERRTDMEPALKVVTGAKAGRIVALVKDETLIGRAGVQVVAVRRGANEVRVVPVEGISPPSVNGMQVVPEGRPLAVGDILEVAGTKLEVIAANEALIGPDAVLNRLYRSRV